MQGSNQKKDGRGEIPVSRSLLSMGKKENGPSVVNLTDKAIVSVAIIHAI